MGRPFHFSLSDALDAAEREQARCEAGVAGWQARRRSAEGARDQLSATLEMRAQHARRAHDHFLRQSDGDIFAGLAAYRDAVRRQMEHLRRAVHAAHLECVFLAECEDIWRRMSGAAEGRVRALREMRRGELRAYRRRIERRQEEVLQELGVTHASKGKQRAD